MNDLNTSRRNYLRSLFLSTTLKLHIYLFIDRFKGTMPTQQEKRKWFFCKDSRSHCLGTVGSTSEIAKSWRKIRILKLKNHSIVNLHR